MSCSALKKRVLDVAMGCYKKGLVTWTSGNMSASDTHGDIIAITPSGYSYEAMTEDDIVLIDRDGNVLEGARKPSSEWRMHTQLYRSLPDIGGVVHTHSPYLTCFATLCQPIPMVLVEMKLGLRGEIPVCDYERPGSVELGVSAAALLKERRACLLESHGALAVGNSVEEAHKFAAYAEDAAHIYYLGKTIGTPRIIK